MNNINWIYNRIANRLGGKHFESCSLYKFEAIKQLKQEFLSTNSNLPLLDLGIGEPDGLPPQCAIEALKTNCNLHEYNGYADNGSDFFKSAAIDYLQNIFNIHTLTTEDVLPIMGIKSGLCLLAGTLVNPGDLVACTVPGYSVFSTQSRYLGGEVYELPLKHENNFLPNFDEIPEDVKQRIKVISLNYPNNPTGAIATSYFYQKVVELALKYHWIIVNDAAYSALDFDRPKSILQISQAKQCCIELHSMSKSFNMSGWRLGWACGNKTLINACSFYKSNCDAGQYLAIQKAAVAALNHSNAWFPKLREKYQSRLKILSTILNKHNFIFFEPKAGFFLFVKSKQKAISSSNVYTFKNACEFSQWLLKNLGIICIPWDEQGNYIRFSVTISTDDETKFFEDLDQRLSTYQFL